MKPKVPSEWRLHYTQSPGDLQAFSQPRSRSGGIVTGLLLLAFIGLFVQNALANPSGKNITSVFGATFVTLLVFGIIPVVMLRRQRIALNQSGLESRFSSSLSLSGATSFRWTVSKFRWTVSKASTPSGMEAPTKGLASAC